MKKSLNVLFAISSSQCWRHVGINRVGFNTGRFEFIHIDVVEINKAADLSLGEWCPFADTCENRQDGGQLRKRGESFTKI